MKSLQSTRVETREYHSLQLLHRRAYLALSRKSESALIPNGHSAEGPGASERNRAGEVWALNRGCSVFVPVFPLEWEWSNLFKGIGKDAPGEIRSLKRCITHTLSYSLSPLKCCQHLSSGWWGEVPEPQAVPGVSRCDPCSQLRAEQCTHTHSALLLVWHGWGKPGSSKPCILNQAGTVCAGCTAWSGFCARWNLSWDGNGGEPRAEAVHSSKTTGIPVCIRSLL